MQSPYRNIELCAVGLVGNDVCSYVPFEMLEEPMASTTPYSFTLPASTPAYTPLPEERSDEAFRQHTCVLLRRRTKCIGPGSSTVGFIRRRQPVEEYREVLILL